MSTQTDEITMKIRLMAREIEIKIDQSSTIQDLDKLKTEYFGKNGKVNKLWQKYNFP